MSDFTARRTMMVDTQVRPSDVTKFPIIDAMLTVPREDFVPAARREAAYLGENTSEDFINVSGVLHAIDAETQTVLASCDLGGQPDSVAVAPDGSFVAVAIENERDEDLGDGRVGQMPAGFLTITQVADGSLDCDSTMRVELTGLAEVGGDDP